LNYKPNNTQIEEKKKKFYDCYDSDSNEDECDYNYRYKQISFVKHPSIYDSKTFHRRRKKDGASSYQNIYRKVPKFDGGFSYLGASNSYSRINGQK
jgi:hypothetical protein